MDAGPWIQQIVSSTNIPLLAALLIGVLASIGPCPLATNVVALSYAARQFGDRRAVLAGGGLYALGRAVAYTVVGVAIVVAGAQISGTARGLQDFADVALGPLLVLVGLLMLGVITIPAAVTGSGRMTRLGERVAQRGGLGLPAAFGIGTSAPVRILGIPLALGIERAAGAVHSVAHSEIVVRRAVAIGFVETGIPLGVTFSSLIATPMVNEVALAMLLGLFGWKIAGLYLAMGMAIAVTAGIVIGNVPRVERGVEDFVWQISVGEAHTEGRRPSRDERFAQAWRTHP